MPKYIEERIRRQIPLDSNIVFGSTPVVSFGNAENAFAATLGLNPSRLEFQDNNGVELVGQFRRLATHQSLCTSNLVDAPKEVIAQVWEDCSEYFLRNPYRDWFDQLERILNKCGASYYNGTACHLDLVQWATDPTWGNLKPASLRKQLLTEDAPFLIDQLKHNGIRLLLLNGMGVLKQLCRVLDFKLFEVDAINGLCHQDTRLFTGKIYNRIQVIAWSTNIQSSFGVTNELRIELANQSKKIIENNL
jgi:hypothetical protein